MSLPSFSFHTAQAHEPYNFLPPPEWANIVSGMLDNTEKIKKNLAIDIGCGPGQFLNSIKNVTDANVVGIDYSMHMIEKAKQNFGKNFRYIVANAEKLPIDSNSVGFAMLRYVLHHVTTPNDVINEAARVLCKDGYLLIETSDPEWLITQEEYKKYPKIAIADISRWPNAQTIENLFHINKLKIFKRKSVHIIRDYVTVQEYLLRVQKWEKNGGGTSFWCHFNEPERRHYAMQIRRELSNVGKAHQVPIYSHGMMLLARK